MRKVMVEVEVSLDGCMGGEHADFWNTWNQRKLETEVDACLRRQLVCSLG